MLLACLDAETEILAKLAAYPDVVLRAANAMNLIKLVTT
jgi:hypothetical protein